jgi:hypothetical protein
LIILDKRTGEEIDISNCNRRVRKLQRRIFAWARGIDTLGEKLPFEMKMIRLSYAPPNTWHKNHMSEYMFKLKRKIDEYGYAWVAELQERGEVHYHLLCCVPFGIEIPWPDRSGMWPWGSSRIENARQVFYIATYTGKEYQKLGVFPKGLRMYSVWIKEGVLDEYDHWIFKLSAYPLWLVEEILSHGLRFIGQLPYRDEGCWAIKERYSKFENEGVMYFETPYEIIRFTSREGGFQYSLDLD